uniref:Uncharacterized protein n=1 Tax=Myoviridae sp. ctBtT5 TaxID=2825048 RepID=A0A8S5PY14_9CAUD|nr:MAG TPA: hypothetical protein [Myoviridae sp. ctBtT5]
MIISPAPFIRCVAGSILSATFATSPAISPAFERRLVFTPALAQAFAVSLAPALSTFAPKLVNPERSEKRPTGSS